jgi:p-aminobenzoyl-glutamate transporter AbgT
MRRKVFVENGSQILGQDVAGLSPCLVRYAPALLSTDLNTARERSMSIGSRVLNGIERIGNKLPDPVFLFLWFILALVILSLVGAGLGWQSVNPVTGDLLEAKSLLAPANLEKLFIEMPKTLAAFPPLGIVLTVVYGAAIAERAGLFTTAFRGMLLNAPRFILTPVVAVTGSSKYMTLTTRR